MDLLWLAGEIWRPLLYASAVAFIGGFVAVWLSR